MMMNLTQNETDNLVNPFSLAVPMFVVILLAIFYSVMVIFAIVGNSFVLMAVYRCKKLRSSTSWLLVNLAISDLINVCISCPQTLSVAVTKHWLLLPGVLSEVLCKLSGFMPMLCSFLSTFTITSIALDRYNIIIYSTGSASKSNRTKMLLFLGVSWLLALLFASPQLIYMNVMSHFFKTPKFTFVRSYCIEEWAWPKGRLYYSISVLCIQLLLPLTIISLAHLAIIRKLKSMPMRRKRREEGKQTDRTNKVLIAVVLVFSFSWLPLHILNLLGDQGINFGSWMGEDGVMIDRILFSVMHILAMSSGVSNPIIYGYFNQGFRAEFNSILGRNKRETETLILNKQSLLIRGKVVNNDQNDEAEDARANNVDQNKTRNEAPTMNQQSPVTISRLDDKKILDKIRKIGEVLEEEENTGENLKVDKSKHHERTGVQNKENNVQANLPKGNGRDVRVVNHLGEGSSSIELIVMDKAPSKVSCVRLVEDDADIGEAREALDNTTGEGHENASFCHESQIDRESDTSEKEWIYSELQEIIEKVDKKRSGQNTGEQSDQNGPLKSQFRANSKKMRLTELEDCNTNSAAEDDEEVLRRLEGFKLQIQSLEEIGIIIQSSNCISGESTDSLLKHRNHWL